MTTVFRVAYSLAVAILFVLFVILGTRTFYSEPDDPGYPTYMGPLGGPVKGAGTVADPLYCDPDGRCFKGARLITPSEEATLTAEERQYMEQSRADSVRRAEYLDERADYHRNVFILASILGAAAVAIGVAFYRRVEALPLGLVLGGMGVVIFGWGQAAEDFGEIGMAPLFLVVAIALAVVMAAGYWFMGIPRTDSRPGGS